MKKKHLLNTQNITISEYWGKLEIERNIYRSLMITSLTLIEVAVNKSFLTDVVDDKS